MPAASDLNIIRCQGNMHGYRNIMRCELARGNILCKSGVLHGCSLKLLTVYTSIHGYSRGNFGYIFQGYLGIPNMDKRHAG